MDIDTARHRVNIRDEAQVTALWDWVEAERGLPDFLVNIVFQHTGPYPNELHAAAARAAVVNMTRTLAAEWGEKGILVNAVGPGFIETDAIKGYGEGRGVENPMIQHLPVRRVGQPREIGGAVAYLFSPVADYVTGQVLVVDGGAALLDSWSTI
ncbi:MAG: SDR family oxidoreductase [Alphaproteobacteria bacterium]|nr:SDR family oxidoreductase [Alphaproteobacteria bacterium]